jgi:hypothetical protein
MSLTVYTVREIKENEKDNCLGVFGSAANAVTRAGETLSERGSSASHVTKILTNAELKSQLRKTGEISMMSEDGSVTLFLNKQPVI